MVGCNFTPSYAINQLEMRQAEPFLPDIIEQELALPASLGMNAVRVYLHDLLWIQDATGFLERIDLLLDAADRHGIRANRRFVAGNSPARKRALWVWTRGLHRARTTRQSPYVPPLPMEG